MQHSNQMIGSLQSLLFSHHDVSSCFFRKPTERELAFQNVFSSVQSLLSLDEIIQLGRYHRKGRTGYDLMTILGILLLKLFYRQGTMKETLLLIQENGNLKDILGICSVPSPASVSRLSRRVEKIVKASDLHERVIGLYTKEMNRMVGHLSIDSTTIEAREKPYRKKVSASIKPALTKKRGRKRKGSQEEQEYREQQGREETAKLSYLAELPEKSISELEMRCSLTAKQNSKGKKQWFIGYKAHLAVDDFGVPISYVVTGACVHDSQVAVPLIKLAQRRTDFFYILLDKGYISPIISSFADGIERVAIVDKRSCKGKTTIPLEPATALRYQARTAVERTNSELKDGYLPDKIYKRGLQARNEIELAILLTTMKKVRNLLLLNEQKKVA